MEPTLHCARPVDGCRSRVSDRVIANRLVYRFHQPKRGDIIVFKAPPRVRAACQADGTFVVEGVKAVRDLLSDFPSLVCSVVVTRGYLKGENRHDRRLRRGPRRRALLPALPAGP